MSVLPMGWKSAVGVMQAIHRGVLLSGGGFGGKLPGTAELKKTAPLPTSADQRCKEAWEVYLDNFAMAEVANKRKVEKLRSILLMMLINA